MTKPPSRGTNNRAAPNRNLREYAKRDLHLWSIHWTVTISLVGGMAFIAILVFVGLSLLGLPDIQHQKQIPISILFDVLKLAFGAVAGVGGALALVMAYRRQRVAEITADRERIRLFNERFNAASEQLGHDQPAIRLAGVYAMAGLADDWREQRQICIDVICAYLRMHYPSKPADDAARSEQISWIREREVRHTAIRTIARHLREDASVSWRTHNFDFRGVVFDGGDFSEAIFAGEVNFIEARFVDKMTSFWHAKFVSGVANFARAEFASGQVNFHGAEFAGCLVNLAGVRFSGGIVHFADAEFSGRVNFSRSRFSGGIVDFKGARMLSGELCFEESKFSGALLDFDMARFSGSEVTFEGAEYSGGCLDFSSVEDWSAPPIHLLVDSASVKLPTPPPQIAS